MTTVRQEEAFGRDEGVIHEAVVTGRKVGAGKAFWSGLAHDEAFFREVMGIAELHGHVDFMRGMFTPSERQLELVRQRNEQRGWGFTDEDFANLGGPPAWPEGKLAAVVLDVQLDTVKQTFEQGWEFTKSRQPNFWLWDEIQTDEDHLRLYPGCSQQRGLSWRILDLGANQGESSQDVSQMVKPELLPHSAVFWAAALHQKWVQSMNGNDIPFVDIPGYQLVVPGYEPWMDVPYLHWNQGRRGVGLGADFADDRSQGWGVPVFRES